MKRFDYRILIGVVLILGGILMLVDRSGLLRGASNFFWAGILAIGAGFFLYWFFTDRSRWWAAIPGFTLAGMAASTLLLDRLGLGGLAFLGGIGIGFWAVYIRQPTSWWAIIPGGVLLTLGFTSALGEVFHMSETAGVFFTGLGGCAADDRFLPGLLPGRRGLWSDADRVHRGIDGCRYRTGDQCVQDEIASNKKTPCLSMAGSLVKKLDQTDSTRSISGKNCRTVPSTQPCNVDGERGQPKHEPPRCTFNTLPSKEIYSAEPPWNVSMYALNCSTSAFIWISAFGSVFG
jgi:hypothetical protein